MLARLFRKLEEWMQSPINWADWLLSLLRPWFGSYLQGHWEGQVPLAGARRIAVFHHWDKRGTIHDYVLFFVRKLAEAGFTIVFTSNSRRLDAAQVAKVAPYVAVVLKRANVGWDFGAYKDAIAVLPPSALANLDMLLITNDSIYGPLQDLAGVIGRADPAAADIWGITDSWDRYYHLQSYFLIFHKAAIASPAFTRFWRRVRYFRRKWWVIRNYEIGLTSFFLRRGVRCDALFPYRTIINEVSAPIEKGLEKAGEKDSRVPYLRRLHGWIMQGTPLNQTHYFWDYLIASQRCPFLKRDLLQKNPVHVPYVQRWEEVLRGASSYDTALIDRHLKMTMRNRVY